MPYVRMPGAKPREYVEVTIYDDGSATISIFGTPEDPAPIEHLPAENALGLGRHMAQAHGFPLYVSATPEQWNRDWGNLTDSFVERHR
ncbi:hypothetical protein [Devosia beringensis]|uniref:hypothetical protein n=1 Tax=Devosia beringensis TaxID=2657486 RepID=UPI00186B7665|nr:hypothetical protein [Devosia beringensis]